MEGDRFLLLVLLFSLSCSVVGTNDETFTLEELNKSKKYESEEYDDSGTTEDKKEKLLELLKQEGKPGWLKKAEQMAKEKAKEMENKNPSNNGQNDDKSPNELQDAASPTQLISKAKTQLAGFSGPLANRVKGSLSNLNTKWKDLSDDDRNGVLATVGVIGTNIQKFGNAGKDPVGAIKGAVDIIASIASNFGPKGQLISMGLGFVSALLGLFGKGPKPKPLAEVVREQIDEALSKYRDEQLTAKAQGLVRAFQESKAYLDGAAMSGNLLSEQEIQLAATRVPITQGSQFLGELASVILKMFSNNKATDAKKCIKYCELYAQLTTIRDMILTQFISLTPNAENLQNDVNGLIAYRQNFRDATKLMFEKLYTVDYDSSIMPYFDPDVSIITDTYSTKMLNLGKYDRSMTGLYCLMTPGRKGLEDLDWQRRYDRYKVGGNPYTTIVGRSNANCYWKLVPHGRHAYSIVNKYKCKKGYDYCDALLSWTTDGGEAFVDIASNDPVLWEIWGYDWRYIRSKWGCGKTKSKWCNYHLRVKYKRRTVFLHTMNLPVGQLAPSDGKYYWKLRRKS